MKNKILIALGILLTIFTFGFVKGRGSVKQAQLKDEINTLKRSKKNEKKVKAIPANKLDDAYRELYND